MRSIAMKKNLKHIKRTKIVLKSSSKSEDELVIDKSLSSSFMSQSIKIEQDNQLKDIEFRNPQNLYLK